MSTIERICAATGYIVLSPATQWIDHIWQHSQVYRGGQNILRIDSNLLHTISSRKDKCNAISRPNDRNCTAVIVYTIRELSHGMGVTASTDLVHIQGTNRTLGEDNWI